MQIELEEGDVAVVLKKQPNTPVPVIRVFDGKGRQLGLISKFSLVASADNVVPKIDVEVCGGFNGPVPISPEVRSSLDRTVEAFENLMVANVAAPGRSPGVDIA